MPGRIVPMAEAHAAEVARLHREGIATGFLTSLGPAFLRQLYSAVQVCPGGFGFVSEVEGGRVLGFIACAESTGRLYKQALVRRGVRMALPVLGLLVRPSILKRIYETLRYPAEAGDDLPPAEVLSIAVDEGARGQGVGRALMDAAFAAFRERGITDVKVAVGADNGAANTFYRKCGFTPAVEREHHGLPMRIYTATLGAGET